MGLKVGVVGAGHMGKVHTQMLAGDKRVTLTGIVDIKKEAREALAAEFKTKAFVSLDDLVGEGVDAIYIATPNTTHTELTLQVLKENIHIFCEKPMATNFQDAKRILKLLESKNIVYQVGHNRRFAPVYKFAKSLIQNGKFIPYSAHVKMNRGELKNPPWVSDPNVTGGFLYESTIHLLDMVRWLLGDVKKVECIGQKSVYKEIDDFALLLTFSSGRIATFFSSAHASWVFPFERIELFGEHSAIITEEMEKVTFSSGLEREIIIRDYSQYPELVKWGYVEEDRLFIDAVLKEGKSAVSAWDGYKSVELVEACYRSIERKQMIDLPLPTSSAI